MLSRNSLLSLIALAVPVGVFALTSLTPSANNREMPTVQALVSANAGSKPNTPEGAINTKVSTAAVTVSAKARSEQPTAESSVVIEAFTEPYRDIAVAASEMGTLSEVKVNEGDVVKQGDVLIVMNDDVLRASLEVARRSMNLEGMLQSAQADLDMKKAEKSKLSELRDRHHASQQEVDRIETELRIAEARLLSVREDLEVKQLEFRRIESQLEQRNVRAPMDGVISELSREAGEFVSPSDPTIARLVQLDPLLIVFSVPLSQRNEVEKDQTVGLKIGTSAEITQGIVEYVSPTSDSSNSSVRVKVRLPNSSQQFQSGERAILVLKPTGSQTTPSEQQESTPVARREP